MKINADQRGRLPRVNPPEHFADPGSGLGGWKVTIPGGRPLATPAVVDGSVFIGGGFGSYDFYAFDACTGEVRWQYQTEDDGPTGAVVAEGCVVFNTESCELEVLTVEGRSVWKQWLGDPLLSMPAVADGRVFQAFPDSRGDRRHYLGCFDLRTGRECWRRPIAGELITCPVLADGEVYLTILDGSMSCFRQADGEPVWQEPKGATSAPTVWRKQCYFSQRREAAGGGESARQQMENLAYSPSAPGSPVGPYASTVSMADYLDFGKRKARSPRYKMEEGYDGSVGFAGHKGDSKMEQAMGHLGKGHVSAIWAYQGSRPFLAGGRIYSSIGGTVHCVEPDSAAEFWRRELKRTAAGEELLDEVLTPPAVVNGKLFLGTGEGKVLCLDAASGATLWAVEVGQPVLFQPAVAEGRVYAATGGGTVVCVETGDPQDHGWLMWGGTPAHNGLLEQPRTK